MCTSNMLYRIPSSLGLCRAQTFQWIVCARGKVARGRMRGHKGTVASLQRLYVIPQRLTQSALTHWRPLKSNSYRHVMLNLFQHLAQSASHQPFGVIPQRACVHKAGIVTLRDLKLKGTLCRADLPIRQKINRNAKRLFIPYWWAR